VVSVADLPRSLLSVFYTGAPTFLSSTSSFIYSRRSGPRSRHTAYAVNLEEQGIEPGTCGSAAKKSDH
jgi:hypothetical protein